MKLYPIAAMLLALAPAMAQEQAPAMNWQDAIGELASERTRAETCVSLLKRHAGDDEAALDQGRAAYDMARAEIDGVIAALSVALAKGEEPESFSSLQAQLERGVQGREAFCETALALVASAGRNEVGDLRGAGRGHRSADRGGEGNLHPRQRPGRAGARDDPDAAGGDQMAELHQRRGLSGLAPFALAALAVLLSAAASHAQEATPGLYERPVLVLDPGVHTAPIFRADVDAAGRLAVTGSYDRTVRVWSRRMAGSCAPSACRRDRATSARSTPWPSAPTAR